MSRGVACRELWYLVGTAEFEFTLSSVPPSSPTIHLTLFSLPFAIHPLKHQHPNLLRFELLFLFFFVSKFSLSGGQVSVDLQSTSSIPASAVLRSFPFEQPSQLWWVFGWRRLFPMLTYLTVASRTTVDRSHSGKYHLTVVAAHPCLPASLCCDAFHLSNLHTDAGGLFGVASSVSNTDNFTASHPVSLPPPHHLLCSCLRSQDAVFLPDLLPSSPPSSSSLLSPTPLSSLSSCHQLPPPSAAPSCVERCAPGSSSSPILTWTR